MQHITAKESERAREERKPKKINKRKLYYGSNCKCMPYIILIVVISMNFAQRRRQRQRTESLIRSENVQSKTYILIEKNKTECEQMLSIRI